MTMFGSPQQAMAAGAPPSMNPQPQMPQGAPEFQQAGPQQGMAPPQMGADPGIAAMANQLYAMQQRVYELENVIAQLMGRQVSMNFGIERDNSGQMVGLVAREGGR